MLVELNEKNFEENIKEGIKFVAVTANWCGYCNKQKPILKEISENNIWIGNIDADSNQSIISKYGISAFPSFLLFKNGKLIAQFAGYKSKYDLLNTLLGYLS